MYVDKLLRGRSREKTAESARLQLWDVRPYIQNSDHGSHEDFQFFKCMPVTVTHNVHSMKYIPSFWCVNLAWSYLPGSRLSFFYWTLCI